MTFTEFVVDQIVSDARSSEGGELALLARLTTESDNILAAVILDSLQQYSHAWAVHKGHAIVPERYLDDAKKILRALKEKVLVKTPESA